MSDDKHVTATPVTATLDADKHTTVSKVTVNSLTFKGVEFEASWETDGLKVPMTINNGEGNFPFFLRIPRDVIVKMIKDINEQLSHT